LDVPIDYFYEDVVDRRAVSRSKDAASSPELTFLTSNENIQLAIAFKRLEFLSHRTAIKLHGLSPHGPKTIYLNVEQSPKTTALAQATGNRG
jgi:hypothetical protein